MKKVNFCLIPHNLTLLQKQRRVELVKKIIEEISSVRYPCLIITGDETWIYFNNDRNSMWIEENPKTTKRKKKCSI